MLVKLSPICCFTKNAILYKFIHGNLQSLALMFKLKCKRPQVSDYHNEMQQYCNHYITVITVKHFLFAMTLFSRKFARACIRENKVLANNF